MTTTTSQLVRRSLALLILAAAVAVSGWLFVSNGRTADGGWQSVETKHFIMYYRPGTHASRRISEAAGQFDRIYEQEAAFAPAVALPGKPKLYLHEQLSIWGYADVENLVLHSIYNEQQQLISGHELMHLFLSRWNPRAPMRYEEGVCRMFEVRAVPHNGRNYDVPLYQLARLMPPETWRAGDVFQPAYSSDGEGNLAAAFAVMTLQTFGRDKFWQFHSELTDSNWPQVLSEFYGQSLDEIDRDFRDFIAGLQPFS